MRQIASQTGDLLRQMRFVAGRGAAGRWSEAEVCAEELADPRMPVWHHREKVATPRQDIRLRGRTLGSTAVLRKMVILNLLVCWREPIVYHSVYVLLNDGFEEGILLGQ